MDEHDKRTFRGKISNTYEYIFSSLLVETDKNLTNQSNSF